MSDYDEAFDKAVQEIEEVTAAQNRWQDVRIRITPEGVLAAAFSELVKDLDTSGWWKSSPLLSGIGLAYHLREAGYTISRIENEQ